MNYQKRNIQNRLNTCNLFKEGEKASEQIKELAQAIKTLQIQISEQHFALKERKRRSEIEEEISKQNYSDKRFLEINQKLEILKEIPLQRGKLLEAKKLLVKLKQEKMEINGQYEIKERSINKLKENQESLKRNIDKISHLKKKIIIDQGNLAQLQKAQDQLFLKKGASQEKLLKINQYQQEQKEVEETEKKLSYQKDIYERLTIAFGKNGIPSMIIENAIPELEEEANAILARLSDEPTTISLEPLRELQSGENRETLDIKIHDEIGIGSL